MHFYDLRQHWRLPVIIAIYIVLAVAYSLVLPLSMGDDEWAHFLYIRFIAEHGRLPVNLAERGNWDEVGYKADDPPLYHLLVAGLTAGIEPAHLLRPINSPQRQLADNVVYPFEFIVHTGPELWPYQGEVLLWHLSRLISIAFGALTIGLTYITSLELKMRRQEALIAAAILAFMPAFVAQSSIVSYDSMSAALTALFLWMGIKAIKQPWCWRWWLAVGGLAGLAITTKYSAVLLPIEIIFIAILAAWRSRRTVSIASSVSQPSYRILISRVLGAGLAVLLAVSWWFGFQIWYFNTVPTRGWVAGILEPLMVRGAADSAAVSLTATLLGAENVSAAVPANLLERNYPQLIWRTLDSFWATPVMGQFTLSPGLPLLFTLAALLAIGGWARYFVLRWQNAWRDIKNDWLPWLVLLVFHTVLIVPLLLVRVFTSYDPREVAQGRHILIPAASAIAILLAWGWTQWHYRLAQIGVMGLLAWSVVGQLGEAIIKYPAPMLVWADTAETGAILPQTPQETLAQAMQLQGTSWQVLPDATGLEVTLWWQSLALMHQDYLVELELLDQAGQQVSFTLSQPVQGRYPTRAWEPGDIIKDVYWLPFVGPLDGDYQLRLRLLNRLAQPVPNSLLLPLGEVRLTVSPPPPDPCAVWFNGRFNTNQWLSQPFRQDATLTVLGPVQPILTSQDGQRARTPLVSVGNFHIFMVGPDWPASSQLVVGDKNCGPLAFDLPSRSFTPPPILNALDVNFNNEIRLLGYDLPTRRIQPGGRLPLTLYWQALDYMGEDYQIFDNLLDRDQRRWGGYDRRARDGYSTLLWTPGEVITDAFGVPVDPAAPPGIYTLDIGLYRQIGPNGADSLPVIAGGQPARQTSIRLGPIKVGGPPPEVIANQPAPQKPLDQSLGGQITLLGYDLTDQAGQPLPSPSSALRLASVNLTLYWRADTAPAADYTTFVHLRDKSNQNVAQKDSPPASGRYPTSLWDKGETIADTVTLSVDNVPPGRYTLVVGLYDLSNGQRLAAPGNPANEITLEELEIP